MLVLQTHPRWLYNLLFKLEYSRMNGSLRNVRIIGPTQDYRGTLKCITGLPFRGDLQRGHPDHTMPRAVPFSGVASPLTKVIFHPSSLSWWGRWQRPGQPGCYGNWCAFPARDLQSVSPSSGCQAHHPHPFLHLGRGSLRQVPIE